MWLYISNELSGRWLVAAGMPMGVVLGCALGVWYVKRNGKTKDGTVVMELGANPLQVQESYEVRAEVRAADEVPARQGPVLLL